MSKINNVGLNLGQKIANPFKTSRNITTPNPFKYSNFEGNSLPFADVFEGFEQKKVNKLKMITSSVMGSMTKLRSIVPESIVNFVNRVRTAASNAWDYAKNTSFSEAIGIKPITDACSNALKMDVVDIGKGMYHSLTDLGNGISNKVSNKMSNLNKDVADKWSALISRFDNHISTKGKTPDELKAMWLHENELTAAKEAERKAA